MRQFRPLDLVLLASGCKIFTSPFTKIIDRIQKFFLVSVSLYFLSSYSPWLIQAGISKSILRRAVNWTDATFGLIFIFVMTVRQEEMRILLETISKYLDERRRDCLRQYAIIASILSWINVVRLLAFSVIFLMRFQTRNYDYYILITSYTHLLNWLFGGIAVYGFFIKSITYMEEEYFDRLETILKNSLAWSVDELCIENRAIMHLKQEIVTIFGPIPCLWLLHAFIRAVGTMFTHHTEVQVTKSITLAIDAIALIWLVLLCDHSKQTAKERTSHLILDIIRSGQGEKWRALIHELEEAEKVNFTAWNMFTITKVVIPAFMGALTPFLNARISSSNQNLTQSSS